MKKQTTTCKEVMSHICDSLGEDLDSPKCTNIKLRPCCDAGRSGNNR